MENAAIIWKFPLEIVDEQTLKVPKGSVVLSVALQAGEPMLWVGVDMPVSAELEELKVRIAGTGHVIENSDDWQFIGTVLMHQDSLVLHIFVDDSH